MKIGVLKEVKDNENRVGMTPINVKEFIGIGHEVYIQQNAGLGCGYTDQQYIDSGAKILSNSIDIANISDIIVKIKEPIESEYELLSAFKNKILLTFLHLSANPKLAQELLKNNITGISYDTYEDIKGNLPLLKPMSVIAGHSAIDLAFKHKQGNLGKVFIVGAGVAGQAAMDKAIELGASDVCVYEPNEEKIKTLEEMYYDYPIDFVSCLRHVTKELYRSDVIVGAALIKGKRAPIVITEDMVKNIKAGAYIIDISIDQGGCIFGSKPTTHSEPTYELYNKTYCCIPNLPGQKPREATEALTTLSMSILRDIIDWKEKDIWSRLILYSNAFNTFEGKIVNKTVAEELGFNAYNK